VAEAKASAAHAAQPFPVVNHVYPVDSGSMAFDLNSKSSSEMAFTGVKVDSPPTQPSFVTASSP
jgi:hypothetical protein